MTNCIFCKIVKGELPCQKVAENEYFLAFLTIKPNASGHTLVIPKDHHRWVYNVPNFGEYWEFTKVVTQKVQSETKADFISYLTMGNEVPHAHIHVIPRYYNDKLTPVFDSLPDVK